MILKSKIFRAYDIRGEAFIDFDEDGFFLTAQAFGIYIAQKFSLKNPKIFVSGDGRVSMPQLFPAVIAGLQASNCEVVWGGTLTTPINYFATHEGGFDASIQISASHNPAQDNGLKLTDRNGAVAGDEIQEILKIAQCQECKITTDFGACVNDCNLVPFAPDYLKKLQEITPNQTPKKIIVDAGNGVSGIYYPAIFKAFGHEVTQLFCNLDGTFPNHQPDPERPENLRFSQDKMKEVQADFAFVFDGDGDRVGIILKDGTVLNADKIMFILVADFLGRNPGEKIVLDSMTSRTLIEKIKELGGIPIVSKTGHSFIEQAMRKENVLLGGEQSGHFMFGENFYGHDDAMLACLRFLQAIETKPELIKAVTEKWPQLHEFSEKITVPDEEKFDILDQTALKLIDKFPQASTLDGVRIDFGNHEWAIIRCSNTSPKIAIRIEANTSESLESKKGVLLGALQSCLKS